MSKTGYKGVSQHKNGKYVGRIYSKEEQERVRAGEDNPSTGYYSTAYEAAVALDELRVKHGLPRYLAEQKLNDSLPLVANDSLTQTTDTRELKDSLPSQVEDLNDSVPQASYLQNLNDSLPSNETTDELEQAQDIQEMKAVLQQLLERVSLLESELAQIKGKPKHLTLDDFDEDLRKLIKLAVARPANEPFKLAVLSEDLQGRESSQRQARMKKALILLGFTHKQIKGTTHYYRPDVDFSYLSE